MFVMEDDLMVVPVLVELVLPFTRFHLLTTTREQRELRELASSGRITSDVWIEMIPLEADPAWPKPPPRI